MPKSRGINRPRHLWTDTELQLLRWAYADSRTDDIAKVLAISLDQVRAKAHRLGLHKDPEFLAEIARERSLQPDHGGAATRFKPGAVPANKGMRRPGYAPGDMAKTQFKPGLRPHTWVLIGSYRVREGIVEIKVNDLSGRSDLRWKPVKNMVWEAAHGPVPAGSVLTFKPGRNTTVPADITLDALECITRKELRARNSIHNLPAPLKEVTRLRASITREISKQQKATP